MDGTIVKFTLDYAAARKEVIDYFIELKVPKDILSMEEPILEIIKVARNFLKEHNTLPEDWKIVQDDMKHIIEKHEEEATRTTFPIKGIEHVLEKLDDAGVLMAVCSLNNSPTVLKVLQKFGLKKYFAIVAGRDVVGDNFKPDPAHGNYILDRLEVKPRDTCMIGDHPKDIEMAINMGAHGIAITSARHPADDYAQFKDISIVSDTQYHRLASVIFKVLHIHIP